ncbi:transmembrane protein 236 [Tamandua tetradactyla]|uniref:transmembrane protein 236 n=1 Tax=Tamandua tetradactyla TaxID=48850 RepID=UPI0040542041
MVPGRLLKLVAFELLEFVAFAAPTLVVMEQFAAAHRGTHYWLIVACAVAYVASVSLLVWVPVKVLLHKRPHLRQRIKGWRPVPAMCAVLTTLPCFCFSVAATEVQKSDPAAGLPDTLPDLPVSLVLNCLILVDIMEKLRMLPLRGSRTSNEDRHIHAVQQVAVVSQDARPREEAGAETYGAQGALRRRDPRAELFASSFLLWADTVEMVRTAGHRAVYGSAWIYPVYIFSFISVLRVALAPENPLATSLGVLLQDAPFIFLRLGLIAALGTVTPVLGLCKNTLVTLSYLYFNFLTRRQVFSTSGMFAF